MFVGLGLVSLCSPCLCACTLFGLVPLCDQHRVCAHAGCECVECARGGAPISHRFLQRLVFGVISNDTRDCQEAVVFLLSVALLALCECVDNTPVSHTHMPRARSHSRALPAISVNICIGSGQSCSNPTFSSEQLCLLFARPSVGAMSCVCLSLCEIM